jgi:hypothetical protein
MAKFVATTVTTTINGVDYSSSLAQVELSIESDDVETTAFGSDWRTRIGGLKQASITLSFHSDFGAGAIDSVLYPLMSSLATVVIKPTSGTVSATNPTYTGTFLVNSYSPIAASVGDLATFDVTWPASGTVTRATA